MHNFYQMKYILVTGGVISGIGKGILSSSLGTILKAYGWNVTCIKIDPYLNIDAGTFSPYEHGEVYVLDDGSEVDLDLGNYERFLDVTLTKDNNITTGKIYQRVMERERRGDYLGKTVQVVPHVTDTIMQWVIDVARIPVDQSQQIPEVCIIELGGTIGDIESMPFVEAFRQMLFRVGSANFCCVHVSLVPQLSTVGEPKTKPTQASVRQLRACGLHPDFLFCRSTHELPRSVMDKISLFSQVPLARVIVAQDVSDLYEVPIRLDKQNICNLLLQHFQLEPKMNIEFPILGRWKALTKRLKQATHPVRIAIVGKYTKLNDAYLSLLKALRHASIYTDCKLLTDMVCADSLEDTTRLENPDQFHQAWLSLSRADAVVVPGGFGQRALEGKLQAIRFCRERGVPFLGLCLGLQCAVIEFARNVLGWKDANSTEFVPDTAHPVVIDMPEHNPGNMGGTMRLGRRKTSFYLSEAGASYVCNKYGLKELPTDGAGDCTPKGLSISNVYRMIKTHDFDARHRHRYEVNPSIVEDLEKGGLIVVGRDADTGDRMEVIELFRPISPDNLCTYTPLEADEVPQCRLIPVSSHSGHVRHPYFVATQFHPEYTSRPTHPCPFFIGLLLAATDQMTSYLNQPYRMSPTVLLDTLRNDSSSSILTAHSSAFKMNGFDRPCSNASIKKGVYNNNSPLVGDHYDASRDEVKRVANGMVDFHIGDE